MSKKPTDQESKENTGLGAGSWRYPSQEKKAERGCFEASSPVPGVTEEGNLKRASHFVLVEEDLLGEERERTGSGGSIAKKRTSGLRQKGEQASTSGITLT